MERRLIERRGRFTNKLVTRLRAYTIALARDRCASRNPLVTGFDIGASFPAKLLPILSKLSRHPARFRFNFSDDRISTRSSR